MSDEKKQAVVTQVLDSQPTKDWQAGTFECCHDGRNCLCGTFCCLCLYLENVGRLDENKCLYCILMYCVPGLPMCMLRGKARKRYNIEGSDCNDCLCGCCCASCVSCQMANEFDHHGVDRECCC